MPLLLHSPYHILPRVYKTLWEIFIPWDALDSLDAYPAVGDFLERGFDWTVRIFPRAQGSCITRWFIYRLYHGSFDPHPNDKNSETRGRITSATSRVNTENTPGKRNERRKAHPSSRLSARSEKHRGTDETRPHRVDRSDDKSLMSISPTQIPSRCRPWSAQRPRPLSVH